MGDTILFSSRGGEYARAEVGIIRSDGTDERYPDFAMSGQRSWQAGPAFSDGRRVVLHSVEDEKTWEHKSVSHLWIYDVKSDQILTEIASDRSPADFMPPAALMPGDERIIINPVVRGKQCVAAMNLDGSELEFITTPEQGYSYGIALSPDAGRIAFHVAEAPNYHVVVANSDGSERRTIASHPEHLYFGPLWSPDGEWLLFQDCRSPTDSEHFRADLCIARPDGSEMRNVTVGQSHWFSAAYGNPTSRASGSNVARWRPAGTACTYTRLQADSRTAWQLDPNPDYDDHFNRDYRPDRARGGSQICLLDPFDGGIEDLTPPVEHTWDFRTAWSDDGEKLAFCRARVGEPPELWVMDADGGNARFLTRGRLERGADHPAWL